MPEKMTENVEEGTWNPMAEAYRDPNFNTYIDGPGSQMEESLQPANVRARTNFRHHRVKVYVKNLPEGIKENGIKNLFLSAGKATSIFLHPSNVYALVEFATPWEAELAIRDLDEAPPYYLKVAFARVKETDQNTHREESNDTNKDEEGSWELPPVYVPQLNRSSENKTEHGSKLLKELFSEKSELPAILDYKCDPHFYQFIRDDFSPSVNFYQIYGDCCNVYPKISEGRSFFEMGGEDRNIEDEKVFEADAWNQSKKIRKCFQCHSETFKICQVCSTPFCSTECLNSSSHYNSCQNGIKKIDVPQKWEYVVPKILEYEKPEISLRSSVFENFKPEILGEIKLTHGYGNIRFGSAIPKDDSAEYVEIAKLKTFQECLESAKIGELVLVPDEEGMGKRGIILSKGEQYYRVALIDTAEVVSVKNVYEALNEVHDIVSFGAKLIITEEINRDFLKNLPEKGGRFHFVVTGPCESNQWPCTLKSTLTKKPVAKALISKWTPIRDLECFKLKNGSQVIMTMYCSTNVVYIRPDDENMREKFVLLNNEVAICAVKSKPLEEPPVLGEMYCARLNQNKCFYRAVVKILNGDKVKVAFVDFGNEQEVKVEDLRPLPEALKRVPCFAVKVVLKNVPKLATGIAVKYLNDLICNEEALIVKFDESVSNQVELSTKGEGVDLDGDELRIAKCNNDGAGSYHGEINRALANDIMPKWMKDKNYKSLLAAPIMRKKLLKVKLEPGEQDLFLLHFDPEHLTSSGLFWATPSFPQLIGLINTDLKVKLQEYCESFGSTFTYLPRKNELCCAFYEGEWLRGVCLGSEAISCSILFIDYGYMGTVDTIGIRRMREEFIEVPALAACCVLKNYEKLKEKPDLQKAVQSYLKNLIESKLKGANVLKQEDGEFIVSINYIERLIQTSEIESSELFKLIKSQDV